MNLNIEIITDIIDYIIPIIKDTVFTKKFLYSDVI